MEYFILGKFSYLQMHDFAGDIFPRYFNLWSDFLNNGFNYWSMDIGAGQDRLSNLVYIDNFLPILMHRKILYLLIL